MTRDELLEVLRGKSERPGDPETHHCECDDALLAYIDDPEITEAFNDPKFTKWYA